MLIIAWLEVNSLQQNFPFLGPVITVVSVVRPMEELFRRRVVIIWLCFHTVVSHRSVQCVGPGANMCPPPLKPYLSRVRNLIVLVLLSVLGGLTPDWSPLFRACISLCSLGLISIDLTRCLSDAAVRSAGLEKCPQKLWTISTLIVRPHVAPSLHLWPQCCRQPHVHSQSPVKP